jgi:hypothetical protein
MPDGHVLGGCTAGSLGGTLQQLENAPSDTTLLRSNHGSTEPELKRTVKVTCQDLTNLNHEFIITTVLCAVTHRRLASCTSLRHGTQTGCCKAGWNMAETDKFLCRDSSYCAATTAALNLD